MPEGFWLKVTARASRRGIPVQEVPIHHRSRTAGTTVVYKPWRVPGIAWRMRRDWCACGRHEREQKRKSLKRPSLADLQTCESLLV